MKPNYFKIDQVRLELNVPCGQTVTETPYGTQMELLEENNATQDSRIFLKYSSCKYFILWFLMEELFNVPKKNYKQLRERPASNLLTFELTILNDNYGKFRPPPKSFRVMV